MGYSKDYFGVFVARWLEDGWLPPRGRLIDFGAQEFSDDPIATDASLREFLRARGADEHVAAGLDVGAVYRAIGIDYVSIDVDGSRGSLFFDLNTQSPPAEWRGAFDFVNNEGTIEHLVNPINGFLVTHELLKVGGVASHSMPLSGHQAHGFMYPSEKFYGWMIGENGYERLVVKIECREPQYRRSELCGDAIETADVWLRLVYRKTRDEPFLFPADHLYVDGAREIAARLSDNMRELVKARAPAAIPSLVHSWPVP